MNKNKDISFVNFPIGNACNLRCIFCYNDSWREDKQYFENINIVKSKLIEYSFKGNKSINLIGGEPLIYPQIFSLLDFLEEHNFTITIVTNGIKLGDKEFTKKILKYKNIISKINISIHSHNLELEDKITKRKGVFNKKIIGIKFLRDNNFNFGLSLVINDSNINYLSNIIYFYKNKFNINISLHGMLTFQFFSDKNIETIVSYNKIIEKIGEFINKDYYVDNIHWIPLCIHFKIKNLNYKIRELERKFIYSSLSNGENLLESHQINNYIGNKCKSCYALGKFCFGPGKQYVKKFGYGEFHSLNKNDVYNLIKKNINIEKNEI